MTLVYVVTLSTHLATNAKNKLVPVRQLNHILATDVHKTINRKIEDSIKAVSYTHLDVYKRQESVSGIWVI